MGDISFMGNDKVLNTILVKLNKYFVLRFNKVVHSSSIM